MLPSSDSTSLCAAAGRLWEVGLNVGQTSCLGSHAITAVRKLGRACHSIIYRHCLQQGCCTGSTHTVHLRRQPAVIINSHVCFLRASHAKYAPAASKTSRAILLASRCLLAGRPSVPPLLPTRSLKRRALLLGVVRWYKTPLTCPLPMTPTTFFVPALHLVLSNPSQASAARF